MGMTEQELCVRLKEKNAVRDEVFLYTVDDSGKENWVLKGKK